MHEVGGVFAGHYGTKFLTRENGRLVPKTTLKGNEASTPPATQLKSTGYIKLAN